jgi:hypothetical protein
MQVWAIKRHKRLAQIGRQALELAQTDGDHADLVCDHFCGDGGMSNEQLYMSISEQRDALSSAGFKSVQHMHSVGTLVMHRAA